MHIIAAACGFGLNASEKRYDATMDAVVGTALSGAAGRTGVSGLAVGAAVLGGFVLGCVS